MAFAPINAKYVVTELNPVLTEELLHSALAGADLHIPKAHLHTHVSTTGRTADDHHLQIHDAVSHSDITSTGAEIDGAVAHTAGDGSDHADVATNTLKVSYTDAAQVAINTTHVEGDGSDHADVATNTLKISSVVTKVLIDTYEGDDTNNREIDLGDDYDEIHIYPEEIHTGNFAANIHAWAIKTTYGNLWEHQSIGYGTFAETMSGANTKFQGKMTGADADKIKLGSVGNSAYGTNYLNWTYRIIAKKYTNVQSLP